jgi:Zn finger protein HypA/HybF involved in hydrogenase expression
MTKLQMPYLNLKASLLTQHGKESVICPELLDKNGLQVLHVTGYDTDLLGTFTRDIPRLGSQLDAARKKARVGMELGHTQIGLASEGAFTYDPVTGLLPWNYELLLLIDDTRNIEMTGFYGGPAQSASKVVSSWDELLDFLPNAAFPSHQLVIRPDDEYSPVCRKGINEFETLRQAYDWAVEQSINGAVFVENDLRAHTNPTRMSNILNATKNLALKLNSICPKCESPGFSISNSKSGLPCSTCNSPTHLTIANIWTCVSCHYHQEDVIKGQSKADPSKCNHCNP